MLQKEIKVWPMSATLGFVQAPSMDEQYVQIPTTLLGFDYTVKHLCSLDHTSKYSQIIQANTCMSYQLISLDYTSIVFKDKGANIDHLKERGCQLRSRVAEKCVVVDIGAHVDQKKKGGGGRVVCQLLC